jgi:5-methylcytosine-specific restriction endonuclease McrA
MRENHYRAWLKSHGISSYENYISRTKRIERYYGDIDVQYDKDGCSSLLAEFIYTDEDKAHRREPYHKIPIKPTSEKSKHQSYYERTKDFASRVNKYIEFREEIQDRQLGKTVNTERPIVSDNFVASSNILRKTSVVTIKSRRNARYKGNPIGNAQNLVIRTILSNLGDESFSEKDWAETKEYFEGKCAYCGVSDSEIVRDHAIPISRYKLGEHRLGNIVPACKSCNNKKGEQDYVEFCGENEIAREIIKRYMSSRDYIPMTENAEKSESIRVILHKAHEEIRVVAEKYIELINDLYFSNKAVNSMPFIDWTGSGDPFDATNIGISVVTESNDDEKDDIDDTKPPEVKQKSGGGCLTTILAFISILSIVIFMIIGWA